MEEKLYPGCQISSDESTYMIYAFALRHHLSQVAIGHLLNLINFHLPKGASVPATKYLLEKNLQPDFTQVFKCFYCQKCDKPVDTDRMDVCDSCNAAVNRSDLLRGGNFFVVFDITNTLLNVLKIPTVADNLIKNLDNRGRRDSRVMCDIMDGSSYKELNLDTNDITCSVNTDGVNVFESSNFSIWPLFISINELDFKIRSKNTMLVGLWFGNKKPTFDTFLKPLVKQFNELSTDGFEWKHQDSAIKSKVFFPIVAADSVARCTLQGVHQHNGKFSCPWCLSPGKTLKLDKGSHKRVFVPENKKLIMRTHDQFVTHLRMLKEQMNVGGETSCFGVLAASQFLLLKRFNIVDGFVMDYMHTALLGVVRAFTNMWLDSKYHSCDFYLGRVTTDINELFLKVKVPYECNRVSRDLNAIPKWKANEWKTWLMLSVPILKGFLPKQYLKHWSKFVFGLSTLLGDRIPVEDISKAEKMLQEFCMEAAVLYGEHVCTHNMHLLLHAGDCVRKWGPLWAYSLFQFENANGVLTRLFKGTTQVCIQIIKNIVVIQQVRSVGETVMRNDGANRFFMTMMDGKTFYNKSIKCNLVTLVGPKKKYIFNDQESQQLANLNYHDIGEAWSFKHFFVHSAKFCTEKADSRKFCNSVVSVDQDTYIAEKVILFNSGERQIPIVIGKQIVLEPLSNCISKVVQFPKRLHIFHCQSVKPVKHLTVYDLTGKLKYVSKLVNRVENE